MSIARVFQSGNSQAIRLPKEFRFQSSEVEIFRQGDDWVLRERKRSAADIFDLLRGFPEDFMADGRQDSLPQERESLG